MVKILPKYKVEISFTASNATGLSFTDVSPDVRLYAGIPINRGRTDQFSEVTAGTASFTLDNNTGTYTPDNAASAFFPNVTRGRAVRISATEDNPAAYTQVGYWFIDTITPAWDNETGLMANALITCVDLSTILARSSMSLTPIEFYAGTPTDWWPLDDPVGTSVPFNRTGSTRVYAVGQGIGPPTVTYQADGLPYGDDGHSVEVTLSSLNVIDLTDTLYSFAAGFTLLSFFKISQPMTGPVDLITLASDPGFAAFAALVVQNDGSLEFSINAGSIVESASSNAHLCDDGGWHCAALKFDPALVGGSVTFYLDGDGLGGVSGLGTSAPDMPIFYLTQLLTNESVSLQHAMAWQSAISGTAIANIAKAGVTGFAGETSVQRVQRIAAVAGYTPAITGTASITDMAPWHDFTSNFWAMLSTVNKTEQGILYIDATGAIAFRTRLAQFNQAPALTLGSDTYEETLKFLHDATNFYNQFTATAFGSSNPQQVTNATSYGNDGVFNDTADLETRDDVDALSFAQIRVGSGKPVTRLPQLDVDLMSQQATFAGLLAAFWGLDLGDLLALTSMPAAAPASAISLFFEGVTFTLTDKSYDATFNLAAGQLAAWVLQDAVLGVLGSTTILA